MTNCSSGKLVPSVAPTSTFESPARSALMVVLLNVPRADCDNRQRDHGESSDRVQTLRGNGHLKSPGRSLRSPQIIRSILGLKSI
jgi:hypothetical protein